jgi:Flp pilus assembly secretin CpaC
MIWCGFGSEIIVRTRKSSREANPTFGNGNAQQTMKLLPLLLTATVIAFVGCSTPSSHNSAGAADAVTDLGRVTVADKGAYNCTLSGNRNCQVRLTSLADQRVLVEAVVTGRDEQDNIRILARPSTVANSGQRVSLGFGAESVSLIPEVKLPAN